MGRSLSLATYMAIARRTKGSFTPAARARPEGEFIWGHATSSAKIATLLHLTARLMALRPGLQLLLTHLPGMSRPENLRDEVIWQEVPAESVSQCKAFLSHWSPDLCLWTSGHLRPALISAAAEAHIPLVMVDADESCFEEARWRWLPNMSGAILNRFRAIFAISDADVHRLRRLGANGANVFASGALQEGGTVLLCDASLRENLAVRLAGRPVWLAAMAQPEELGAILAAHRIASRLAHRLLLVIVPDDPAKHQDFLAQIVQEGWRAATWSEDKPPDENTQVLLADSKRDLGLWYRLAPVTLMGSSLVPGHGGRDPFEPAGVGSAVLYGPSVGRHLSAYTRFANAGAARIVKDAETLAAAVSRLIAPDQSASMALAAWEVSSHGAEATDSVVELVQDTLDMAGNT